MKNQVHLLNGGFLDVRPSERTSGPQRFSKENPNEENPKLTSVILGLICAIPATIALGQVGPLTWSSFVIAAGPLGPYDSSQPATSNVVSSFTPAKAIKVTRVEIQAAQGSEKFIFSPSFTVVPCTNPIAFRITDGSNSFTLPLPSAATLVTGAFNPTSADSGKLNIMFPAEAKLVMQVVLGDPAGPDTGDCVTGDINISVQYEVQATEENEQ